MKSLRFKVMMLILALLPVGAFAANNNHKGDLNVSAPVQVAGKQLPAGDYVVKWDGTGPTTQVNILRNGTLVATVPARVIKLDQKADEDAAEVTTASNGDRTLTAIRFGGKIYALEIGGEATAGTASGDNVK